ncbi:hypothetical protein COU59_00875 [Candidatus Pacearchaeota archaeon CG10_big_fil_rev_8_21_14_0_10_34_12]|nr:MAG: hypothetical protein COU59_00875 [Candidatus Pacearchaeota archaeon CG10_big_fil_rev_8_21_14_0_10_34_12]
MGMVNEKTIFVVLVILLITINYNFLNNKVEDFFTDYQTGVVERVIDGDTLVLETSEHVRLLGINTPEKGEPYYEEAKEFLESRVLNKSITLKYGKEKYDKYQRLLAYVFLENENINVEIVESGLGNYYFYDGRDKYSGALEDAWTKCLEEEINLCEPSQNYCKNCIEIAEDYVINSCSFSCDISDWEIKGEGREKFVFSEVLNENQKAYFELDLSDSGRTLFLRDSEGKLVLWETH